VFPSAVKTNGCPESDIQTFRKAEHVASIRVDIYVGGVYVDIPTLVHTFPRADFGELVSSGEQHTRDRVGNQVCAFPESLSRLDLTETTRSLIWEHTANEDRFGCSDCSWTFPNPRDDKQNEHDMASVHFRFQNHSCDANLKRPVNLRNPELTSAR
jgi:hypothetical protein